MTTATANATVTATPIQSLYRYASRANGSQILALDLDKLNDVDIRLEEEHYNKTLALRIAQGKSPYGSLRGTSTGGLVRGPEGVAVTMFGDNLHRQSSAHGGIANLLRNWGGGKRVGVLRPAAAIAAAPAIAPVEVSLEERLKAIKDEEARLLALVQERDAEREAALDALTLEVHEFVGGDIGALKEILKESKATDLATGLRAAKAAKAAK